MSAPDMLTRAQAYAMIEDADAFSELSELAAAWELAGHWNERAVWDADTLREHVDNCCDADAARSNGPHEDDVTNIPADAGIRP